MWLVVSSILCGMSNAAVQEAGTNFRPWWLRFWPEDGGSDSEVRSTLFELFRTIPPEDVDKSTLGESQLFISAIGSARSDASLSDGESMLFESATGVSTSFESLSEEKDFFGGLSFLAHDCDAQIIWDDETDGRNELAIAPSKPSLSIEPDDLFTKVKVCISKVDQMWSMLAILWRGQLDQALLIDDINRTIPTFTLKFIALAQAIKGRMEHGLDVQYLCECLLRMRVAYHVERMKRAYDLVQMLGLPATILAGCECSTEASSELAACDACTVSPLQPILDSSREIARRVTSANSVWQTVREILDGSRKVNRFARNLEIQAGKSAPVFQTLRQYSQDFTTETVPFTRRLSQILEHRANILELQSIMRDLKLTVQAVKDLGLFKTAIVISAT